LSRKRGISECHVVLDCETTGLSPYRGHRIIEIGAVLLERDTIVDVFQSLIDTGVKIPAEAQAVHGITPAMIAGQPKPEETFPRFHSFIRNSVLVAHNASFDIRFLRHEFERLGLALPQRTVCTMEMSRRVLYGLPNYRLETVYHHLFPLERMSRQTHRALDDALITARIWLKLKGLKEHVPQGNYTDYPRSERGVRKV